ncbi:chromosome segregation ATPase, partial [Qipengyuania citrea]|nr:chromosome segregation ATPase [Qipengyuania citrea]
MERLTATERRFGPVNLVASEELARSRSRMASMFVNRRNCRSVSAGCAGRSEQSFNREVGRERLRAAFEQVNDHFQRLFMRLFEGGEAHLLALIDSDDPLEAGLEIFAQPPGKKLQSLTLLSGGEQALTATALIFAAVPDQSRADLRARRGRRAIGRCQYRPVLRPARR